jgi:hypothetical protein
MFELDLSFLIQHNYGSVTPNILKEKSKIEITKGIK